MVTWQFKFRQFKFWSDISKYNLKLEKIKTCQPKEINKDQKKNSKKSSKYKIIRGDFV